MKRTLQILLTAPSPDLYLSRLLSNSLWMMDGRMGRYCRGPSPLAERIMITSIQSRRSRVFTPAVWLTGSSAILVWGAQKNEAHETECVGHRLRSCQPVFGSCSQPHTVEWDCWRLFPPGSYTVPSHTVKGRQQGGAAGQCDFDFSISYDQCVWSFSNRGRDQGGPKKNCLLDMAGPLQSVTHNS